LCTFKHSAPVLAIAFHPRDDRFFLAGCKDAKLRLWSIPDKRIEYWVNTGEIVTAVGFSPDGKTALAGTMAGSISLYSTENMKSIGQIPVRGKKKSRITGIEIRYVPPSDVLKVLVTTTDSRIRLYNLRDKALELKLKAHRNDEIPMKASFNDDGRYVISGSEDKGVYIWSVADTNLLPVSDRERDKTIQRPLEYLEANASKTTCAVIAPFETRLLLGQSGDPIYDICNPPPVKLVEREGSAASSTKWNGSAGSVNGNAQNNGPSKAQPRSQPLESPKFDPRKGNETPKTVHSATFPLDNTSSKPSYQARSSHDDGLIIVTACTTGIIRIFRQDCAFRMRKSSDAMANPSVGRTYLRRALASSRTSFSGPPSARPGSIHSFKAPATPSIKSLGAPRTDGRLGAGELTVRAKGRSESVSSQPTRDRIERWRADVDGRGSTASLRRAGSVHSAASNSTTQTNSSPSKGGISSTLVSARQGSVAAAAAAPPRSSPQKDNNVLRPQAESSTETESGSRKASDGGESLDVSGPGGLERRSSSYTNPLRLQGGQSFMFWNTSQYQASPAPQPSSSLDQQISHRLTSVVSRLTDESDDEDDDGEEESSNCPRCGGAELRRKESRGWGFGKQKSIICEGCGLERREAG
jgi:WD repeat-containing protein 44